MRVMEGLCRFCAEIVPEVFGSTRSGTNEEVGVKHVEKGRG